MAGLCGHPTLHLDLRTGRWEPDAQFSRRCLRDPQRALEYCRQVGVACERGGRSLARLAFCCLFPAGLLGPGGQGSKKAGEPGGVAGGAVRIGRDLFLRKGHKTKQKKKRRKKEKKKKETRSGKRRTVQNPAKKGDPVSGGLLKEWVHREAWPKERVV